MAKFKRTWWLTRIGLDSPSVTLTPCPEPNCGKRIKNWKGWHFFNQKQLIKQLNNSYLHDVDETEERMNKQLAEAAKRENVLVLRLSAREQELQDVAAVAVKYRQQQVLHKVKK